MADDKRFVERNSQNVSWTPKPIFSRGGLSSNVPLDSISRPFYMQGGMASNVPLDSIQPRPFYSRGGLSSNVPLDEIVRGQALFAAQNNTAPGLTAAQRNAMIQDKRTSANMPMPGAPESDPYLDLLNQLFQQAGQGSGGADLSGYNASLKMLGRERKRMKKRYKKYQGQIADIYGTLTGINQSMIENIAPAGEAVRADLAAQEGEQAAATRKADAARLEAATQARAGLGLEDLAGEYAEGDVATEQAEGMITDRAANTTAAQNTLLANEAIARQQLTNQNLGRTIQQEGSNRDLQRSLEDALAAIRGERANVLMQRAQAAGSGSGPNIGAQLSILERIQQYTNPQAPGEPSQLETFQARNPGLATPARQAADTFAQWMSNAENYNSIPSVRLGRKPSAADVVSQFLTQTQQTVPQAESWGRNSELYNLLVQLANTAK
jgi:hypothetical protein